MIHPLDSNISAHLKLLKLRAHTHLKLLKLFKLLKLDWLCYIGPAAI